MSSYLKYIGLSHLFSFQATTPVKQKLCSIIFFGLLTACSDSDNSNNTPSSVNTMTTVSTPTVPTANDANNQTSNVPSLTDTSYYLGTQLRGRINSYNPRTGEASNFSNLDDDGVNAEYQGSMDIANNRIMSVATNNTLNAIEINTGNLLWSLALGEVPIRPGIEAPTPPVCADNVCYSMGFGGDLAAVDVVRQRLIWSTDFFPRESDGLILFPLLVTRELVFAGGLPKSAVDTSDVKLFAVSRSTGAIVKQLPAGLVTMADDLLLISGIEGFHAYDFDTLEPIWSIPINFASKPAVVGDIIAVHVNDVNAPGTENQRVQGLNRLDGSFLWSVNAGTAESFFTPTTDGRLIYTAVGEFCTNPPCDSGYPMALNPADGAIVWVNRDVDISQTRPPIVIEGELLYDDILTFSETGNSLNFERGVGSLNSSTGQINWISSGPHAFTSLTAFINNTAYRSSLEPTFYSER